MVPYKVICRMVQILMSSVNRLSLVYIKVFFALFFITHPASADIIDSIDDLLGDDAKKPEQSEDETRKNKESEDEAHVQKLKKSNENENPNEKSETLPSPERKSDKKSSSVQPRPKKKKVPVASKQSKKPIKLTSEGRSTYSRSGGTIHLRENVVITQDDLKLRSNEAKVYVDESNQDETVRKVEVIGEVKITKSDADASKRVTARGNSATFLNTSQKITLKGNARLWRGGHLIRGKQITYDITTGLITVDEAVGVVQPGEEQ